MAARKQKQGRKSAQVAVDEDYQLRYERVAGIDVAKAKADVCTRLPPARDGGSRGRRGWRRSPRRRAEIRALAGRLLGGRGGAGGHGGDVGLLADLGAT